MRDITSKRSSPVRYGSSSSSSSNLFGLVSMVVMLMAVFPPGACGLSIRVTSGTASNRLMRTTTLPWIAVTSTTTTRLTMSSSSEGDEDSSTAVEPSTTTKESTSRSSSTTSYTTSSLSSSASSSQQAEYGKSLELPTTYATCGQCGTAFALTEADLNGSGRRLECSVCGHSWYQSGGRINSLSEGYEMVPLPERDLERIQKNLLEGKAPRFTGDMKLYVGNLSFTCTEEDVYNTFSEMGTVGEVSIVRDETGRNRGFGFVTMRDRAEGERALAELEGKELKGRNMNVRESTNERQ